MAAERGARALIGSALLDAARRVFAERGFDAASVDEVAAAAGLTKGAAYSRFATKEELFVAAALRHDDTVLATVRGRSPRQWAKTWARSLDADRWWAVLGLEFRLYGLRHPQVAPIVRRWQRASHARLVADIERRVVEADLRLRVPATDAASIVAAAAAGIAQQRYADSAVPAERLMRTVLSLLVADR